MTRLNDVNANLTFIKLVKRHRNIFAVSDIPAQPFAAKPIGAAFDHIATVAEGLDKLLQSEFGGSTAFSEPMPSTRKH